MANGKQASARRMKMAERARQQKDLHFPEWHEDWLWHRTRNDGFTTLPRTMPLIMQAVDALSGGHPAGQALLTLWCRSPDHALVTIESPGVFAAESGFTGLRAVDSWRRRMRKLVELGFIATKPGASGDFHYVLLLNPHWAIERRQRWSGDIPASIYNRFVERVMDVGAFGEIETVRGHLTRWEQEAALSATAEVPPPPLENAAPEQSQTDTSGANSKD
jgi:hypothetical protein